MRKNALLIFTFLISLSAIAQINTPAASPAATVSQEVGLTKVTINYSRPSVKGRKIFGDLVPNGKVWRTGANRITSIKLDDDMLINGASVKAGSYGLYTIPGEGAWTIIINRDDKQWGSYEYDQTKDVIRFSVQPLKLDYFVEQMEISFEDFTPTSAYVAIKWESTGARFKIEHPVDDKIMAEIKEKTAKADATTDTYFTAADYYYQKGINLNQALDWAKKVLEKDKEYWTYQLVARIASKMGDCKTALPNAEKSMELATKAGDDAYIKLNQKVFVECGKK
ncbi:MAG: DUF2911 domain-containing protein [Spirosomataceae bacterium]